MNILKRYPLLITFPLGLCGGAVIGFVWGAHITTSMAAEARKINPNDPLDLLWINYIMFPAIGAFAGIMISVFVAIIIHLVSKRRRETLLN